MPKLRTRIASVFGLLLLAPATAHAAFPGANGRIAFSSGGDIWTVGADGAALAQLTSTPDDEAQAAFSPDGTRIAYRRRPAAGQPYQVYAMNADGSGQQRVSQSAVNDTQPGWSPDGRTIVFRRSTPGDPHADVWAMNADGTNARALVTSPGADERYPVFSPDGTRLAFSSDRDGQYEIYVAAADGAGQTRLTTDPGYDAAPSWSPDARAIAFERGASLSNERSKDVWIMGADGAGQAQLTFAADVVDEGPAFSPDGAQIAFTSGRDGNYEMYRMARDGSGQARVIALGGDQESPDWQPLQPAAPPPPPPPPPPPDPDRDRDGLLAGAERALRTSDLDRDSDDDGLSDGRESRRLRTRPDRRDSDRDGLTDGVESGVRKPIADPPGPVRGTARSRFRRDADPRTRTDPRRRDSDRDGRSDGREDRNRNGRRDRGETDPLRR